jgi:hypothetical protein
LAREGRACIQDAAEREAAQRVEDLADHQFGARCCRRARGVHRGNFDQRIVVRDRQHKTLNWTRVRHVDVHRHSTARARLASDVERILREREPAKKPHAKAQQG